MNRVIGIPGYLNDKAYGVGKSYLAFAQEFGDPVILMPHEEPRKLDLLLLPGGLDLNPASYGEVPSFYTTDQDVFKQYFYDKRLPEYVNMGVPIFGICLGFQQIAAFFGSKLTQNLKWHETSASRWEKAHKVRPTAAGKILLADEPAKAFDVNSHHHQGVHESNLGADLLALATEDLSQEYERLVEAVIHRHLPIAGVQWHPEEWYDEFSTNLVKKIMG